MGSAAALQNPLYRRLITAPVGQMPASAIKYKVGNLTPDVVLVKKLLAVGLDRAGKLTPMLKADLTTQGWCSPFTIKAIMLFQEHHFGISNGRVDPDNVTFTKLCEEAWNQDGRPGSFPNGPRSLLDQNLGANWMGPRLRKAREDFAVKARTFVDAISDEADSDGKRHGWAKLKQMFEETVVDWPPVPLSDYQTPKLMVRTLPWCGIFAIWALRQFYRTEFSTTLNIQWRTPDNQKKGNPMGIYVDGVLLPTYDQKDQLALGDICITDKVNVHHVIVTSDPSSGSFQTVEGNFPYGPPPAPGDSWRKKVASWTRSVNDVWYYYSPFRPHSM